MTTLRAAEQLGLAARVRDVPDAPVLLFVHGLGCDASFWDEAWTSADLERYSLLAVDLPGFGAAAPGISRHDRRRRPARLEMGDHPRCTPDGPSVLTWGPFQRPSAR